MIARRLPLTHLLLTAWLALAWTGATMRAAEDASPTHASAPTPAKPVAEVQLESDESATPAAQPAKRATNEVEGLLNIGDKATSRGDYSAGEIAYHQVLNLRGAPETHVKTALLNLALMHRRQGAMTKSVAVYERFLKDYPTDDRTPDALLNLGRTLRAMGMHKLAITRFYSVINSTLKVPGEGFERYQILAKTAQFEIAETHFQAGEFAQANKYFSRLRLLDLAASDRARAHFMAGYSLRLQGDLEGSIKTLRSYVDQWPQDENVPEARYLLAITLRELKRTQEAFATTLDLLRTEKSRTEGDPKRWAYWQRKTGSHLANEFFETGDTLNARAIYAGLLDLSPEPGWRLPITYQLGLCYERLGVTESAVASYKAIVEQAGPTPTPDLYELVTIAKWRIEHLDWREKTNQKISSLFDSTTSKLATASGTTPAPPKAAATP
jgi:tetratricopeptide (TPR) repeat protein